ncbi:MAG: linked oxidase domain protein [Acidimicrobiaceae bacterium]|nr:linked oxidase domain protein [Acidimicrobiaceae bacterium]
MIDSVTDDRVAASLVSGWGRASPSAARVVTVRSRRHLEELVVGAGRSATPVLARGLGRSYGDAAQCAGGMVLDCTPLGAIAIEDLDEGIVRVEGGVSLDALLREVVPRGWFVPVTPGTAHVTVGGAIAADVHGKNHHRDGAFGSYVQRIELVTPSGGVEVAPASDPELFWATLGGMGLTGAIAEADVRLHRIETSRMLVDTVRARDLDECMEKLSDSDASYRYSVAWVDCAARGSRLGRSVLSLGDHAALSDLPAADRAKALDYRPSGGIGVPFAPPVNLVQPMAIAAANELWYRKARLHRAGELQSLASFFYPLDAVRDWNRLYGPRGFTQYQFVVPFGAEETVRTVIELLQAARLTPSLAVLKRFGKADPGPMSFPSAGWTLALDIALSARDVAPVLDRLDDVVADAQGRVYLAKDGRLRPELLREMYPRLEEWLAVRARVDPTGVFVSDQWRRVGASER